MKKFRSNGKLFLIGEYIVMDGAKAFALPTKFGQCLFVEDLSEENCISWKATKQDQSLWFDAKFSLDTLEIISTSDEKLSYSLQNILRQTKILNPDFFKTNKGYCCLTKLEYPQEWGLGSSSTLIDLISQWVGIDPFVLNHLTFNTSGYDIACAHHDKPILFSNQPTIKVEELELKWDFTDQLYFVFLNQKQDTQAVVGNHYKNKPKDWEMIHELSDLVLAASQVNTLEALESILTTYQNRLEEFMKIDQPKATYFPDYQGVIKSLGAWGGDFVLVTYREGMFDYFQNKGYNTIIPFQDMIL
ncbi:GYDIA family GHMP kinase [Faecalibacter sp. LW9]|uniref:GYDIA family GHMP kinase n=1 Tax=Faecalibacter sp. LW9 TaxID=3103144 RepID=UPI002AFEC47F|nr:GYDIA family GHMP kinase [Faecalibacter sp. LW9]